MAVTILITGGTLAQWEAKNPILKSRQLGVVFREDGVLESDLLYCGDGVTHWKDLQPMNRGKTGVGLEFAWDGTNLGLRREGDASYIYTDLKGATGVGLEFTWDGSKLGVRREGTEVYSYTDLIGPPGYQGDQGEPGVGIPTGGAPGQLVAMGSGGTTQWVDPPSSLPDGGTTNQILAKTSDVDQAAGWIDPPSSIPAGGVTGQALVKKSNTDKDVEWGTVAPTDSVLTELHRPPVVFGTSFPTEALPAGTIFIKIG